MMSDWYHIDLSEIDTPALLIDKEKVAFNIDQAIIHAGGLDRLRPHVKTHKILDVARMQLAAGIKKFKCATIPEAEMLGMAGAEDVLIAYQPQGPKIQRIRLLKEKYPATQYAVLIDNNMSAAAIDKMFSRQNPLSVYIDINDGQNRTGIKPENVMALIDDVINMERVCISGLHCYDGHIRMPSLASRVTASTTAFSEVTTLRTVLEELLGRKVNVVAGGSPSFSVHAKYHDVECSPGTFIFWDERYASDYAEMPFQKAAILATRVISKIDANIYCLDLGHKSVASEFPFPRIKFMSPHTLEQIGHSEEHLVVRCTSADVLEVGQLLLGYPYHICPTVALYDHVHVVNNGVITKKWKVLARDRMITV